MTNLVAELAKFARHRDLCAVDQWLPTDVEDWAVPPCNCGLAQLLEQVMQVEPKARQVTTVTGIECWGWQGRHPGHLYPVPALRLAKCPFCGDEAGFTKDIRRAPPEFPYAVECSQTSCGIRTPFHYRTEEAAAEAWNRRVERRRSDV